MSTKRAIVLLSGSSALNTKSITCVFLDVLSINPTHKRSPALHLTRVKTYYAGVLILHV